MRTATVLAILCLAAAPPSAAQDSLHKGPEVKITRAAGTITLDGDLSDAGWRGAVAVDKWVEVNPGDNVPPPVKSVGYLTYDDKYFYAGFEFFDPDPKQIRAPYMDRDQISNDLDYGGVFIDPRNDGKSGVEFIATPRGIQFDAVRDDTAQIEDSSPDYYWDAAGKIGEKGWTLEIRIPFSSLRYGKGDPQTWGVALFRCYPRQYRHQLFSVVLPRDVSCFVCMWHPLTGLSGLPKGGNVVAAPYVSATQSSEPEGALGSRIVNHPVDVTGGLDVKWTPNASTAVDATINPDFSQVESDVAQISVNERFALFYPEKRPFFLEGTELFQTPISAVYTRSITSPRWGLRGTGRLGSTAYTILAADDRGGGSVIIPGPQGSIFADQDFSSTVAVGRLRHDIGTSSVSFLAADRELRGGGHNRVFGPDFQLRPNDVDTFVGQLLFSTTATPERPDLADEWDGRSFSGHALQAWWTHGTKTVDWAVEYKDFSDGFRADVGFVPQVGFRQSWAEAGYTLWPTGLLTRFRGWIRGDYQVDREGRILNQSFAPGFGLDGRWNSFLQLYASWDRTRAGDVVLPRRRFHFTFRVNPTRWLSNIQIAGNLGEGIDFAEARTGHGGRLYAQATLRPTDHLNLQAIADRVWLDVAPAPGADERRLFTAQVERLKATYTFSARSYVRVIGQYVHTRRDPTLHASPVPARNGGLSLSALVAYKLNWQSVLFLGYGDERALTEAEDWEPAARQLFLKISYAFQR